MTEVAAAAFPMLGRLLAHTDAALPQTGRAMPLLAAGVAIGVALLLRLGGWRLGTGDADADGVAADAGDKSPDPEPDQVAGD